MGNRADAEEFAQLISESLERERLDKEGLVKRERIIISIFRLPRRDRWNLEERGKSVVQNERMSHPGPTRAGQSEGTSCWNM